MRPMYDSSFLSCSPSECVRIRWSGWAQRVTELWKVLLSAFCPAAFILVVAFGRDFIIMCTVAHAPVCVRYVGRACADALSILSVTDRACAS